MLACLMLERFVYQIAHQHAGLYNKTALPPSPCENIKPTNSSKLFSNKKKKKGKKCFTLGYAASTAPTLMLISIFDFNQTFFPFHFTFSCCLTFYGSCLAMLNNEIMEITCSPYCHTL